MKNMKFEALCQELLALKGEDRADFSFPLMCMAHGLGRNEAEEMFYREFGLSGEEVLEALGSANLNLCY